MVYVFRPYPSIRYFREADGRIGTWTVHTVEEDRALGPGCYDSPAKVPELGPTEAVAPAAPVASPGADESPARSAPSRWGRRRRPRAETEE